MSVVRRSVVLSFIGFALLSPATPSFAQAEWRVPHNDSAALIAPKNVVRRYIQMESEGFRLSPDTSKRQYAATVNWKTMPDWTEFQVISAYEVGNVKPNGRGATVSVAYAVLGQFHKHAGYTPDPHTETLELETVQQDGDWKIVGNDVLAMPRISRARTLKWLRDQLAVEQDTERKSLLQDAIKQLQQ